MPSDMLPVVAVSEVISMPLQTVNSMAVNMLLTVMQQSEWTHDMYAVLLLVQGYASRFSLSKNTMVEHDSL